MLLYIVSLGLKVNLLNRPISGERGKIISLSLSNTKLFEKAKHYSLIMPYLKIVSDECLLLSTVNLLATYQHI